MEINKIYNEDCLEGMKRIPDNSVDLILSDLPYGTVKGATHYGNKTDWDEVVNTVELFNQFKRILKTRGRAVLTAQEPFTTELQSHADTQFSFNYRMVWVKDGAGNPLMAKKAPLKYFEDILVFTKELDLSYKKELREYFKIVKDKINLPLNQIIQKMGSHKAQHSLYCNALQFGLCTEQAYKELTELFSLRELAEFKEYSELKGMDEKVIPVYNILAGKSNKDVFQVPKDIKGFHPTQKPVKLFEQLIKIYSNEQDTVLDNCMGSGTTAIACMNTNRNYIGFELDEGYYEAAIKRIGNHEVSK